MMIPDSVKSGQQPIDLQSKYLDVSLVQKDSARPSGIHFLRFRVSCFSDLRAEEILAAMKALGLNDPELERSRVFSWDTNSVIDKFVIKCWYPRTKTYEEIEKQIRELIFENGVNQ